MAQDKYISVNKKVSGFSFANLGLFTGFADGIYNAVYSLVILDIFRSSATVGIYVALYSLFCLFVGLFANEIFRRFSKVRVFYFAILMLAMCYAMMSFSILPRTFIILDFTSGIGVNCLGYNNSKWLTAVENQIHKMQHCSNIFVNPTTIELSNKLTTLSNMSKVFFANL